MTAVPVPSGLSGYRKEWLRPDALAGLITAAVVIPKAMAHASVAGLPVQVGLSRLLELEFGPLSVRVAKERVR